MFVERLKDEDIADYVAKVTLRNETFDSIRICSISNWNNRLGECQCRQVDFCLDHGGEVRYCQTDIEDFSFIREHCFFMLKHFGEEYLNYLRFRVGDEDISEDAKASFIKQNISRLAYIKTQENIKQQCIIGNQKSLSDFEK